MTGNDTASRFPTPGQIWNHRENGYAYTVTGVGKQKQPGGEWVPAVFYQRADGTPGAYAQALEGFLQRFGRVEEMALTLALKRAEEAEAELARVRAAMWARPSMEELAKVVHSSWRDGMLRWEREVAPERMEWDTLDRRDQLLDQHIAGMVLQAIRQSQEAALATMTTLDGGPR